MGAEALSLSYCSKFKGHVKIKQESMARSVTPTELTLTAPLNRHSLVQKTMFAYPGIRCLLFRDAIPPGTEAITQYRLRLVLHLVFNRVVSSWVQA